MTTTELHAGRELDVLIAITVMGWTSVDKHWGDKIGIAFPPLPAGFDPISHAYRSVPNYSTDIAAAWLVVERVPMTIYAPGVWYAGGEYRSAPGVWSAEASVSDRGDLPTVYGNTAPLAICRAALLAVEAV